MDLDDEVIEISDSEGEEYITTRQRDDILRPVVGRVVDALGGYEKGVYRLGDECYGCLKDLKKLWRKDDTDDERTVARIFFETRVLSNDLVPILLETAGKGLVEDKRAIACADLMTAMTWPIDLAEELRELDDELDRGTDYTQLMQSHLHYKAALLKPGVMEALMGIMVPPLAKPVKERTEKDGQIINVVLHLIRNLAFIKDLRANAHLSADQAGYSSLQSTLIQSLSSTRTVHLLLAIASNPSKDPLLIGWNTLVLEILYLLFRGVKPSTLAADQKKQPAERLHKLLAAEERNRREIARTAASRHSRFGTTIAVKLNPNHPRDDDDDDGPRPSSSSQTFVLHRQQALKRDAGSIWDIKKRQRAKRAMTIDELTRQDNLSLDARLILRNLGADFLEGCFNPFLASILKDIRSERPKIVEKDHVRLLYVTKWFLDFFLCLREAAKQPNSSEDLHRWGFGLVAEVTERQWIVWVLKRMRGAVEEKPKLWTELQAGIECLTQLLLLIDTMSATDIDDADLTEAADLLQQQIIYNGEVLDITIDSLRAYREGTQSLAYLDSSVHMSYVLLRMLERWSKAKSGEMYVRKKKTARRRKRKGMSEEDGVPDVEDEAEVAADVEQEIKETIFTFEAFEMRFANAEITHTLLKYLSSYKEFPSSDNMKRVVGLLHRQAVRAKAEGLFFQASTLDLFKTILADKRTFPIEQPYKDLVKLVQYILRQFFKALEENPFLAVETFFPKNRGNWKQFSSWQPPAPSGKRRRRGGDDSDDEDADAEGGGSSRPAELRVKDGYSWSDQLGIAIAALVDAGKKELVEWTTDILTITTGQRRRVVEETDGAGDGDEEEEEKKTLNLDVPSQAAREKMEDYLIPYLSDEQASAATGSSELQLLFRLCGFRIVDEDAQGELEWHVPASSMPAELTRALHVIQQFLEKPIDLEGKKAAELLSKKKRTKRRRRTRRAKASESGSDSDALGNADYEDGEDGEGGKKKRVNKRKKKLEKEAKKYKSAEFIEDSDDEPGELERFLAEEKAKREKAANLADAVQKGDIVLGVQEVRPPTMRATGTKKRRRPNDGKDDAKRKKRKSVAEEDMDEDEGRESSAAPLSPPAPLRPRPRPRPRPVGKAAQTNGSLGQSPSTSPSSPTSLPNDNTNDLAKSPSPTLAAVSPWPSPQQPASTLPIKKSKRLVLSDDEDE